MCHDHDTGSELAVKQVEVGLLNSATQKVCDPNNIFSLISLIHFHQIGDLENPQFGDGMLMNQHKLRNSLEKNCVACGRESLYIKQNI